MTKRDHANRRRKLEVTDVDLVRSGLDDEYEILEELGRGGMGIVYRARERQLEREVAIKVLPFTLAFDRELVERFLREARTAAALEHTNIVPIYRVGRRGDVIFFVMKLKTRSVAIAGITRQPDETWMTQVARNPPPATASCTAFSTSSSIEIRFTPRPFGACCGTVA